MTARLSLYLETADDTEAMGRDLARLLRPGDIVLLEGQIGAGKSHLARSAIRELMDRAGTHEDIPSPTYTIVQEYSVGPLWIIHADLYRLGGAEETIELGLDAAFEAGISFVEWPERLEDERPRAALTLVLSLEGAGRRLDASGPGDMLRRLFPQAGNIDD